MQIERLSERDKEERVSNRKHKRIILRFEPLALRLRLHRVKDFHYSLIPRDHHSTRCLKNESDP